MQDSLSTLGQLIEDQAKKGHAAGKDAAAVAAAVNRLATDDQRLAVFEQFVSSRVPRAMQRASFAASPGGHVKDVTPVIPTDGGRLVERGKEREVEKGARAILAEASTVGQKLAAFIVLADTTFPTEDGRLVTWRNATEEDPFPPPHRPADPRRRDPRDDPPPRAGAVPHPPAARHHARRGDGGHRSGRLTRLGAGQTMSETQGSRTRSSHLPAGQRSHETHRRRARPGNPFTGPFDLRSPKHQRSVKPTFQRAHSPDGAQTSHAPLDQPGGTMSEALTYFARSLDDLMHTRIIVGNREGAMERAGIVNPGNAFEDAAAGLDLAEKAMLKAMKAAVRRDYPAIEAWRKSDAAFGIGDRLLARLLGEIGDPVVASPLMWVPGPAGGDERVLAPAGDPYVRTVSQLWAYCGVGKPGRMPKGADQARVLAGGKPKAKMILRLMAEGCVKANKGPYRFLYDGARAEYADRTHAEDCAQCRAKAGDPWKLGHQHAAALRKVSKEILKDLYAVQLAAMEQPLAA